MAEGGHDPETTNPFDPRGGDDDGDAENIPLIRKNPVIRKTPVITTSTSTPKSSSHHYNPSFIDETPSGKILGREEMSDKADKIIKDSFPNANTRGFFSRIEDGRVEVRLTKRKDNVWYPILDEDGDVLPNYKGGRFPKGLDDALGKSTLEIATEKIAENTKENEKDEERIKELDEQIAIADGEDRNRLIEEQNVLQDRINVRIEQNQAIEERLSLKQRIKEIFKKYGFTAFAVATAIATVIGVIVSNLKAGLTKVAKGVGNGLKELGKKLGEILPGMIGAIASFIFRTAGEVIGFLAKNAWLLIVGLVVLAVEQLKKKSK